MGIIGPTILQSSHPECRVVKSEVPYLELLFFTDSTVMPLLSLIEASDVRKGTQDFAQQAVPSGSVRHQVTRPRAYAAFSHVWTRLCQKQNPAKLHIRSLC